MKNESADIIVERTVGHLMPSIAFGTWRIGNGNGPINNAKEAFKVGFTHLGASVVVAELHSANRNGHNADTAQAYGNEVEAGRAIRESGLPRDKIFVTTKYSGRDGLDIKTSIHNSLKNVRIVLFSYRVYTLTLVLCKQLGLSYVDLYLIHHPILAKPDIPTAWKEMEKLVDAGLVRSIGVSNFTAKDLALLVANARIIPAANQVR
jgi:diketogulonate reductase-like aldo/keto reductase